MFKLTILVQTSDHDDYCSGNECEYDEYEVSEDCSITFGSEILKKYNIGDYVAIEHLKLLDRFIKYIPDLGGGSYQCSVNDNCEEMGLDMHDYKVQVIQAICLEPFE